MGRKKSRWVGVSCKLNALSGKGTAACQIILIPIWSWLFSACQQYLFDFLYNKNVWGSKCQTVLPVWCSRLECDTLPCAVFQRPQAFHGLDVREPRAKTRVAHGDGAVLRGLFRRLSFFLCEHLHGPDHHHFPGRRREGADRPGPGQEPGIQRVPRACWIARR